MFQFAPYIVVGALRKVAKLHIEGMTIDQALVKVAQEIDEYMIAYDGKRPKDRKVLTYNDIKEGKFLGDLK